jgi:hypothetical protein
MSDISSFSFRRVASTVTDRVLGDRSASRIAAFGWIPATFSATFLAMVLLENMVPSVSVGSLETCGLLAFCMEGAYLPFMSAAIDAGRRAKRNNPPAAEFVASSPTPGS